jgi:arylsulfatase A
LPALLGEKPAKPCREYLIEQDNAGSALALRKGPWKLVPGNVRGRRKAKPVVEHPAEAVAKRDYPPAAAQLYNLADDLSETKNVAAAHPDIVAEMSAKLAALKKNGRSRP